MKAESSSSSSFWLWLEQLRQDFRYAVRTLARASGFTAVVVLTLALGIGGATSIFSIVNAVVLRPLPYPDSDRLVALEETLQPKFAHSHVSPGAFLEWRKQCTTLDGLTSWIYWPCIVTGQGEPSRRYGIKVSAEYFTTLGVQPVMGRNFRPEESTAGKEHVVILNYKVWLSLFGGRPDIINQSVEINDQLYTVIGVMPMSFMPDASGSPGIFAPAVFTTKDAQNFKAHNLQVFARLKPGVTLGAVASELKVIAERLELQYPATNRGWGVNVLPLIETKIGEVKGLLLTLFGAVGFLLLIACVNVANLLLARGSSRQKEIALRAALGASRGRIVRQLLCESLLLSLLGGALGVWLARVSRKVLLSFGPIALPRAGEIAVDGSALLFTCALVFLTGIGFGLIPALQATRTSLMNVMKEGQGGSEGRRGVRLRSVLVIFQVALALILLTAAGLLMRSVALLRSEPLGFSPGVTYLSKILLQEKIYRTPDRQRAFVDETIRRISAVPGVRSVGFSTGVPVWTWGIRKRDVEIAGRSDLDPADMPPVSHYTTTPEYFKILSLTLKHGRFYSDRDGATAAPVVVVNESFAQRYFPDGDALGKRISIVFGPETWREIIGIVGDVKEDGPAQPAPLQVYEPLAQRPNSYPILMVECERPVAGIKTGIRTAIDAIDPGIVLGDMSNTLDHFLEDTFAAQRFALFLFAVFSGAALLLSAMGIYGVVAYSVSQRTQEIGIRVALGATRDDILRLIFGQTARMVGAGLVLGVAGSLAASRLLASLLFKVEPHDPSTILIILLVLAVVSLLACWWPAHRATQVDPNVALRSE